MKAKLIVILCLFYALSQAQNTQDTIFVTKDKVVNLFFPKTIKAAIKGSKYLIFKYDKENNFGSVLIAPGKESNLTIILNNGLIYSFIVKYKENIKKLNYFLKEKDAINKIAMEKGKKEKDKVIDEVDKQETEVMKVEQPQAKEPLSLYDGNKKEYIKRLCLNLSGKAPEFKRKYVKNSKIILKLKNIVFDKNELYFSFNLKNNSGIDYNINFIKVFLSTLKKKKKTGLQDLELEPELIYHLPKIIKSGDDVNFIYVFKKFTIGETKEVVFEVNEEKGERNLRMHIPYYYINNAD